MKMPNFHEYMSHYTGQRMDFHPNGVMGALGKYFEALSQRIVQLENKVTRLERMLDVLPDEQKQMLTINEVRARFEDHKKHVWDPTTQSIKEVSDQEFIDSLYASPQVKAGPIKDSSTPLVKEEPKQEELHAPHKSSFVLKI